ncbi:sugar phosphate isomerase/epimerase family protein [Paraburkholderia phosphatilytica]|uniref:sugar phosphate isomerase/epimerase family protein n=1 Tax=Paraburkholderia phosphatilytica TaxID=2282883 RepID=UPI000E4A31A4|nr:sugar phosphate isomerase/epimerase [Paraburkholderia phosphatilytica]
MPDIAIVASAFGAEAVRRDGHRAWIDTAVRAGAAGFEVRRELFATPEQTELASLCFLGSSILNAGLWTVYSTPDELFAEDGTLNLRALRLARDEAATLRARIVKLQLGNFQGDAHAPGFADEIAECVDGAPVRVVVENGQLTKGGALAQFVELFQGLAAAGREGLVGMTFDVGNWLWAGEVPLDAATRLTPYVEYIHCKAVQGVNGRRFAVAPAPDDASFAQVLRRLPGNVPRGIEFPFDAREPNRIATEAGRYVEWLAAV